MKTIKILLGVWLSFGLVSCTSDQVKDFMPGTYVNSAGGAFSMASDTLIVEQIEGNNYQIFRRTGYHLISGGKLGPKEYESEQWSAVYDRQKQTLLETRKGKIISFYPQTGVLKVSRRVYEKIN